MVYINKYESPLGNILISADDIGITGLWFEGQKYFASNLKNAVEKETNIIKEAKRWLQIYFSYGKPDFTPPLHLIGTDFQHDVWQILLEIPYSFCITYNDIARKIALKRNILKMSAQAVGGAVSHNAISIIVPCHRVIGSDGSLTGYAGGLFRKKYLLDLEKENIKK